MVQSNRSIEQDKEAGTVEESAQQKKDARENHMSNSPIWDMNRLWEDKMLEDWRVLESSVAESGKRNREVPGIGTALVVSEVDELV
ncbi:hypothetical protein V6N12_067867 [Hibiscus sabdariffa]|uniref:Uncharacterized protein n=1 Tax=Hibiscus sabdariffa TaxID=183260 RepID=A0ABR2FNK4_9ROSI